MKQDEDTYFIRGPRILHKRFEIDPNEFQYWNLSYSQQGEDLILRSMLKQKLRSGVPGVYVDLGSHDCRYGSNTYLFYRYGWRGICVEVNPLFVSQYRELRPRDIFVNAAVGEAGTGYWAEHKVSAASNRVGTSRDAFGPDFNEPVTLAFLPLTEIFDRHLAPGVKIDFMSIDVEGNELSTLRSNDWTRHRPGIIVIEDNGMDATNLYASAPLAYLRDQNYVVVGAVNPNIILEDRGIYCPAGSSPEQ